MKKNANHIYGIDSPILCFTVGNGSWETLTAKETVNKVVKSKMIGVSTIMICGETHKYLKFLNSAIPILNTVMPVILSVEGCKNLFVERMSELVSGICLEIKLPVIHQYRKTDRRYFRRVGEYRNPNAYKSNIITLIEMIRPLQNSILKVNKELMSSSDVIDTINFLSSYGMKTVVINDEN